MGARTAMFHPPGRSARRRFATACAVAAALGAGPAMALDLPARKPGLWEITMQVTNSPSQTVRQCIDEKTDVQMQRFGQGLSQQQCTKNTMQRDGDRYVGESECKLGPTVATSRSVFGGDFDKAYRGEVETRYAPPMAGISQSKVTMSAKWAGACPAGWKPGDMEMPGMGRVNVNELMTSAPTKAPKK
ncbi:MAG: DUF3617 family protein [Burkholderiales bacterium]|nr:MAG: DUF3617 family protein [Burkholderiales bacterium]